MRKDKEDYQASIKQKVFQYQENTAKEQPTYHEELFQELKEFIQYTNAVEDDACRPYILNGLGILNDEKKCRIAEEIAQKTHFAHRSNENAAFMHTVAMTTLCLHSSMDITRMDKNELFLLNSMPIGQDYIDFCCELLAYDKKKPLNVVKYELNLV